MFQSPPAAAATAHDLTWRREREKVTITYTLLCALGVGVLALGWLSQEYGLVFSSGLVWGLALYASGLFLGFLFGIPRAAASYARVPPPAEDTQSGDAKTVPASAPDSAARRSTVNSNLVEVSDWLTKIIVGVGLVELKELPGHGQSLAGFIAGSLAGTGAQAPKGDYTSVAGAIALYFGVLGFITGYLLTRVFLAVLMNLADRDADRVSLDVELPAGTRVPMASALVSLRNDLSDVQTKLLDLIGARRPPVEAPPMIGVQPPERGAPEASLPAPLTRAVLWVDNHPNQNALIADRLRGSGIKVHIATSTRDAMALLEAHDIPVLITDMHRDDDRTSQPAGMQLLSMLEPRLRSTGPDRLHAFVFCSRNSVQRYSASALAAGATGITASTTDLLAGLARLFGELSD